MSLTYPSSGPVVLRSHLGDRPSTHGLVDGRVTSPLVKLDISGPRNVPSGFKPLLRERAYDFSELSVMTYLQAREHGKPWVLLPAVVLARFQHGFLACRADAGLSDLKDLEGKRIGIRSYTVTTVCWMQAILRWQYGVDPDRITWVAHEDSHLAEFRDPPNVERISFDGRSLEQRLADGDFDAAVLGEQVTDPRLRPVISDPQQAARDWYAKFGAIQLNHMVVVSAELSEQRPDVVAEIYDMLLRAKAAAGPVEGLDLLPFGVEYNRRNLEVAIDCAFGQNLISRRFSVDELCVPPTRRPSNAPTKLQGV